MIERIARTVLYGLCVFVVIAVVEFFTDVFTTREIVLAVFASASAVFCTYREES